MLERRLAGAELDLARLVRHPEHPALQAAAVHTEIFVAAPSYLEERGTPRTAAEFRADRDLVFDRSR